MRMIKSLWTKPGGWNHPGAADLWRLSVHRLVEHHGHCDIYPDALGAAWLHGLRLPSGVRIVRALDGISIDPHLWSAGKLATYAMQQEPFIHTDADVIIGCSFARRILAAEVCAERVYQFLPGSWMAAAKAPAHWRRDWRAGNGTSFNCGMFGGRDIAAIRRYATTALQFIQRNQAALRALRADHACMAAEEWAIAREFDPLEVSCYSAMTGGGEMHAHCQSYWHLCGPSKRAPENLAKVRHRLAAYA